MFKFPIEEKCKIAPVGETRLITEKDRNCPSWMRGLEYNDYKISLLACSHHNHSSDEVKYNKVVGNLKQNREKEELRMYMKEMVIPGLISWWTI